VERASPAYRRLLRQDAAFRRDLTRHVQRDVFLWFVGVSSGLVGWFDWPYVPRLTGKRAGGPPRATTSQRRRSPKLAL